MRRRGFSLSSYKKFLILILYCLTLVPLDSILVYPESLRFLSRCCGLHYKKRVRIAKSSSSYYKIVKTSKIKASNKITLTLFLQLQKA